MIATELTKVNLHTCEVWHMSAPHVACTKCAKTPILDLQQPCMLAYVPKFGPQVAPNMGKVCANFGDYPKHRVNVMGCHWVP